MQRYIKRINVTKWGLSQECNVELAFFKPSSVIHHINRQEERPYDHLNAEKAFRRSKHPFLIKTTTTRSRRKFNLIKGI